MGEPPQAVHAAVEAASDPESESSDGDDGQAVDEVAGQASEPENSDGDDGENDGENDSENDDACSLEDPVNAPTLRLGESDSQEMPLSDDHSGVFQRENPFRGAKIGVPRGQSGPCPWTAAQSTEKKTESAHGSRPTAPKRVAMKSFPAVCSCCLQDPLLK